MGRRHHDSDSVPHRVQQNLSFVIIPLKWVGGITAILSLLFGLQQTIQLVSNLRERQRHIAELYKVGKLQQSTADYKGAWASFEQALKTAEAGEQLPKLTG